MDKKDLEDVKLARPVSVVDLWDIDNRVDRLEDAVTRLEKVVECLVELYHEERVKSWDLILGKMMQRGPQQWRKDKK